MKFNVVVPSGSWFNPFNYCAKILSMFFPCQISNGYRNGMVNVLIYDLFHSIKWMKRAEIGLLDTPCLMESLKAPMRLGLIKPKIDRIYVTCRENRDKAEAVGVKVDGVIYRLCHPLAFKVESDVKVRDFCSIGNNYSYDRKNLRLIAKVVDMLSLDCEVLTDAPFIKRRLNKGVSDEVKFKWLGESRFLIHIPWNGSFEMPVYEAMACGVPPIYSEIPCLKEYAVGLSVRVEKGDVVKTIDGDMVKYVVDEEDFVDKVKYALGMKKEEYEDLSVKCRLKALAMQRETIDRLCKALGFLEDFSDFGCDFV